MKTIKIVNNSATIVSDLALKDIERLRRFRPEALQLKNKEDEVFFSITTNYDADINAYGIEFSAATEAGNAAITMLTPVFETTEERDEYLKVNLFEITRNLVAVERQAIAALKDLEKEMLAFKNQCDIIALDDTVTETVTRYTETN